MKVQMEETQKSRNLIVARTLAHTVLLMQR
jgi:hypothetical protein